MDQAQTTKPQDSRDRRAEIRSVSCDCRSRIIGTFLKPSEKQGKSRNIQEDFLQRPQCEQPLQMSFPAHSAQLGPSKTG